MPTIEFIVQRGNFVAANHGERWRVLFYDRELARHYAGSGPTLWIAVALALQERARRSAEGEHPRMARTADELDLLARSAA